MFIAALIFALIAGLGFIGMGLAKVIGRPMMEEARSHLRIPTALWRVIGILEVLGGAGLLIGLHEDLPAFGVLSATGLVGMTIGATFYHQRAGDPMPDWLPAVVMGSLVVFYAVARVGSA